MEWSGKKLETRYDLENKMKHHEYKEDRIYGTIEYDMLKLMKGNREIKYEQVNRIKAAMKEKNYLDSVPILINAKFEIVDGQFRYMAARDLKATIPFRVQYDADLETVQGISQHQRNWGQTDFANSYAVRGNADYEKYVAFQQKWKFNHSATMHMLTGSNARNTRAFNKGLFKVKLSMEKATRAAEMIYDFERYFQGFKERSFVAALLYIFDILGYNHKRMIHKMKMRGADLPLRRNKDEYIAGLEKIYNYKVSPEEKMRFVRL
jgi:hypothetical protein